MTGARQSHPSCRQLPKRELVVQGDFRVSDDPGCCLHTLLGSCVASCIWDPVNRVGGMNHLLISGDAGPRISAAQIAAAADMERLINAILAAGAVRENLKVKVFGGAQMSAAGAGASVGSANCRFVTAFLEEEGIECLATSLGGTSARNVRFWPATGRAEMRLVSDRVRTLPHMPHSGGNGLELF